MAQTDFDNLKNKLINVEEADLEINFHAILSDIVISSRYSIDAYADLIPKTRLILNKFDRFKR